MDNEIKVSQIPRASDWPEPHTGPLAKEMTKCLESFDEFIRGYLIENILYNEYPHPKDFKTKPGC